MNTIDNTMERGKLAFTRLYFKKSKNRKGEECYISKVKNYDILENGKKKFLGDAIVIANTTGRQKANIDKEGRWDVKCKRMHKGSGFVVIDAVWTIDDIEIKIDGWVVKFLINGRQEKLKTDDGKYIPLYFDRENWYDPEVIVENIERKLKFLQLPPKFSFEDLKLEFLGRCNEVQRKYKKKAEKSDSTIDEASIDKLKEKWGNR